MAWYNGDLQSAIVAEDWSKVACETNGCVLLLLLLLTLLQQGTRHLPNRNVLMVVQRCQRYA